MLDETTAAKSVSVFKNVDCGIRSRENYANFAETKIVAKIYTFAQSIIYVGYEEKINYVVR